MDKLLVELERSEMWAFKLHDRHADRVFLAHELGQCGGHWHEMGRTEGGAFRLQLDLCAGRHRFHWYANLGDAYLDHGQMGLEAKHVRQAQALCAVGVD